MSLRHDMRALVALAAAYALALQAILLAAGAPLGARGAEFGGQPICSGLGSGHPAGSGPAPFGHTGDCPGTCLGCCCGPATCHLTGPAMIQDPAPAQTVTLALIAPPPVRVGMLAAHRSRAPPLA
jgi:hypothetical protein